MSSGPDMVLSCGSPHRVRRKLLPVLAPDPWEDCADLAKEDLDEIVRSSRPSSREGSVGTVYSSSVGNSSPTFSTTVPSPRPTGALWLSSHHGLTDRKFGARESLGATSRDSLEVASTVWAASSPGTSSLDSTARSSLQPSGASTPKADMFAATSIRGFGVSAPVCTGCGSEEHLAHSVRRSIMSAVFAEKGSQVEGPNLSRLVPVMLVEEDV